MELTRNRRDRLMAPTHTAAWEPFFMPTDRSVPDLLTDGQRRHLVASLANVAAALSEIESLARRSGAALQGSLLTVAHDLPPGFDQEIEPSLNRARLAIGELAAALGLEAPERSACRSVQALVTSSLVVLEDTGTRNLHGYGEIHPSLPQLLEPALCRIHEEVRAIGEALAATRSRRPGELLTPRRAP
jgi:hypothetical protein